MAKIPQETLAEIKTKTDLVALVQKHLELRRSGQQYKGLCPFHEERTPSFYVDPKRQSFKCYGCGEWGSAIDFLCKIEGRGFLEVVRQLAHSAGVALPELGGKGSSAPTDQQLAARDRLFAINHAAMEFFRKTLQEAPFAQKAREYQASRGIDDALAERFCLGYAPAPTEHGWDSLANHLKSLGHPLELAEKLGLVVPNRRNQRYFDRYRGRWIFPIVTPGKSVVGFSGRILPEHDTPPDQGEGPVAKYVNSPETSLFKKSEMLFGLHAASRGINARRRVILVEGNVDVLALHAAGFSETLAPLGTALTAPQCKRLRRLSETVILCLDGDRAGRQAAWKALPLLLEQDIDVRIVALDDGMDPGSMDPAQLAERLETPPSAIPWFLRYIIGKGALSSIEAKNRALASIADILARITNPSVQQDYGALAATMFQVPVQRVDALLHERKRNASANAPIHRQHPPAPRSTPLPPTQTALLHIAFHHMPELARNARIPEILGFIDDPRLIPLAKALAKAGSEGNLSPAQGELLADVDKSLHRTLHDRIFKESYKSIPDPDAALDEGLRRAQQERLEQEITSIDAQTARARDQGDSTKLRTLVQRKIELRREQAQLRSGSGTL